MIFEPINKRFVIYHDVCRDWQHKQIKPKIYVTILFFESEFSESKNFFRILIFQRTRTFMFF